MIQERWNEMDISAYLDGQLTPERLAAFEKALAQNTVLRQRVAALRKTINLLRETPLRESPRNYLLTPSMVADAQRAQRPRKRSIGIMRLATSMTAAAFVLTMGINVLSQRSSPAAVMQPVESLKVMQSAEADEDVVVIKVEVEHETIMAAEAPVEDMGGAEELPLAMEAPVVEEQSEAPLVEGEMKVTPESEILTDEEVGVGGGGEPPAVSGTPENPAMLEEPETLDTAEMVETERATAGEVVDSTEETEIILEEGDTTPPLEDLSEAEAILAVPPEDVNTAAPVEKAEDVTWQNMYRYLMRFTLPRWLPTSLGVLTLLMLAITLLLSIRRP